MNNGITKVADYGCDREGILCSIYKQDDGKGFVSIIETPSESVLDFQSGHISIKEACRYIDKEVQRF